MDECWNIVGNFPSCEGQVTCGERSFYSRFGWQVWDMVGAHRQWGQMTTCEITRCSDWWPWLRLSFTHLRDRLRLTAGMLWCVEVCGEFTVEQCPCTVAHVSSQHWLSENTILFCSCKPWKIFKEVDLYTNCFVCTRWHKYIKIQNYTLTEYSLLSLNLYNNNSYYRYFHNNISTIIIIGVY